MTQKENHKGTKTQKAIVPLYDYQKRWVGDRSRFKIAVKSTQIGYSFAASLEAVFDCIQRKTLWIILSRGERQSLEFMQKVREHAQAMRIAGSALETSFFEKTDLLQHEVKFPNGSRIIGVPANPDTARGYTGNMVLDEFAFHQQAAAIWAAAFGRISRGDLKLRVISTPNGTRGKYYEIAKDLGLVDGYPGEDLPVQRGGWSGHWCDIYKAVADGCPIDTAELKQAIGDDDIWRQEYECIFLSDSENYIPLDLIAGCESSQAWVMPPEGWEPTGECFWGLDVGRKKDLSVLALVEKLGDTLWVRMLQEMSKTTFAVQEKAVEDAIPLSLRGAMDASGLGMQMAERLAQRYPGRAEPVTFTAVVKQDLATRMKRQFEERLIRIPDYRPLRRDLNAVKRIVTQAGNVRFDAERDEHGHADRFWALALALHAADSGVPAAGGYRDPAERMRGPFAPLDTREREDVERSWWTDDPEAFAERQQRMGVFG